MRFRRPSGIVSDASDALFSSHLYSAHYQCTLSPNRRSKFVRRPTAATAMSDRVSMEGSDTRSMHRPTATETTGGGHIPPMIGQAHRRMSRPEGPPGPGSQRHAYRRSSVASSFRTDHSSQIPHAPHKLANTYRLAPREDEVFSAPRVQKAINSVLK